MENKVNILKKQILDWMEKSNLPLLHNTKMIKAVDHLITLNFLRYLIIGFTTFFLDFGIFQLLDTKTSIQGLPANMLSTLLSLGFNFYMSNFWTFKAGGTAKMRKLSKYGSLAIFNYAFSNTFFFIVSEVMNVNSLLTKVMVTGIIVCWNYFLYKLWIFKAD